MTPKPSGYPFVRHITLYQRANAGQAGSEVALADIWPDFVISALLRQRTEADINAPDLSALFKPLVAQSSLPSLREGPQHLLPCSRASKQSMDENNCCLAVRIFIEKHGKYLFPLTGACAVIIAAFHYYHDLIGNWHAIEDRLMVFAVPRFVAQCLAIVHMTFCPA
jgi:hypothetical protein